MYSIVIERGKDMQTFHGSMKYDASGRKRKTNAWTKRKKTPTEFKPLETYSIGRECDNREKYPSVSDMKYTPRVDTSYKLEESKKFTVAPAFNKGAYQVIPSTDIKHIGK
ncbi:MAG: hypothetical protein CMA07_06100 [Euryarchaeota archaeon]|jgi:hypothetical protein|nr:hypothetical protein [Euryarchaeota archaeon]|tara:strand:+ start:2033 stop:2362 length:330 start_codon:yes stop_codon:yes gene_type:complete